MRKGTARRAWVLGAEGDIALRVVCARCALRSIGVVVPPPAQIAPLCSECKREPARVCACCYVRAISHTRELLAANAALATTRGQRLCPHSVPLNRQTGRAACAECRHEAREAAADRDAGGGVQ
jgi:hypothetical protein